MAEPALNAPRSFGQYDVESVLGRGAMGMVYLARDRRIGRKVALKTVQVDQKFDDASEMDEFFKRLQREAEVVGAMQHPNIVTLYEPGYENNVISYLATEYVDGESLKDRLKRSKPLPLDEALRLGEDILRGLAYAHGKGIIHRDIKPANILVSSEGQAKLADFGIARPIDSSLTAAGSMLGTPNYMSPEQVKCAPVTTKSDLFSAGSVLYELLTGVKPFASPDVSSILRNVVERTPPPANEVNANVPEPVGRLVARLLEKTPEARIESAAAALAELQRLRAAVPPPPIEEISPDIALSTISHGAGAVKGVKPDDSTHRLKTDTTPETTERERRVPAGLFWGVVAAVFLPFGAWAVAIRMQTDARPTAMMTAEQHAEYGVKKQSLAIARGLAGAGQYDQAIAAYDGYLKKYPESITAKNERAAAVKTLDGLKAKASVTSRASKPKPKVVAPPPEEKKRSLWNRIFRRGEKKPSAEKKPK